ncbi:MAG: VTC domain-containing protein [Anaerolineae bacterium]|nr:VTC domain-containing protein [Anaerolineae bacterium]
MRKQVLPKSDYGQAEPSSLPLPRYEVKIPLPATLSADVDAWVRLHPAHWKIAYPPRQVNNVYFDSAALTGLNGNLSGVSDRAKLRLRWYGPDLGTVAGGHLELKRKQGMAGWKETAAVPAVLDLTTPSWPALVRELRATTSPEARAWLNCFAAPVLVNHYQRAYYATPDGRLRLTVDRCLCAYPQRAANRPNLSRESPAVALIVVELKAPIDAAPQLSKALAGFPAPVDRFSKYVQGMGG